VIEASVNGTDMLERSNTPELKLFADKPGASGMIEIFISAMGMDTVMTAAVAECAVIDFGDEEQPPPPGAEKVYSIWIEGEDAVESKQYTHSWYSGTADPSVFSGGDWISHYDGKYEGVFTYEFTVEKTAEYRFWLRLNKSGGFRAECSIDGGDPIILESQRGRNSITYAKDGTHDMRFIMWLDAGTLTLEKGEHTITFTSKSSTVNHMMLDCFFFTEKHDFLPVGTLKPPKYAVE
jgi:hypothetical protein